MTQLARTKALEEALEVFGVPILHWIKFSNDVGEDEKQTCQLLQKLQQDADEGTYPAPNGEGRRRLQGEKPHCTEGRKDGETDR